MPNRMSNLKEATLTIVGISVNFIHHPSFHKSSHCMWHGSLFKQLPNTQRRNLPFPTHTQNKNKNIYIIKKIKNPKNGIEKNKRREKRKKERDK
jgi:hypothetical protein